MNKQSLLKNNYKKLLVISAVIAAIAIGYSSYRHVGQPSDSSVLLAPPAELKGKVITLRPLTENLFIDHHNSFSANVRKNLEFPEVITLGYTIRYLQEEMQKAKDGKMLLYCIFDNKDNNFIGSIEIREKNDVDPGQLGCWLNEAYRGGGRIQEALRLITETYFRLHPEAHHYIAHVRPWNKASYKALIKFGLKDIGYYYQNGKPARHILEYTKP